MFDQLLDMGNAVLSFVGISQEAGSSEPQQPEQRAEQAIAQLNQVPIPEISTSWNPIIKSAIWDNHSDGARNQLFKESRYMHFCEECGQSGIVADKKANPEEELVHKKRCSDYFRRAGMGPTLIIAVEHDKLELIDLIKELSISEPSTKSRRAPSSKACLLTQKLLLRAALLAAEKGRYNVIMKFGFLWLEKIALESGHLSDKNVVLYGQFVMTVLKKVFMYQQPPNCSIDEELSNLEYVEDLLAVMLPRPTMNRYFYDKLMLSFDENFKNELLFIVGAGQDTRDIRDILVNDYGILFSPIPSKLPPGGDSLKVINELAEKIIKDNIGRYHIRHRKWLRDAITRGGKVGAMNSQGEQVVPIKIFVLSLLRTLKKEIMSEVGVSYADKLQKRYSVAEVTMTQNLPIIYPTKSEELWNRVLRVQKLFRCCPCPNLPRVSRRKPAADTDAEEVLLPNESSF
ncbi:MAG: hypothetical protein VXW87_03055 [Pseudomonadota bacterium]|nr:hypothetical protein [Pseudomonadota bacterium]